MTPKRKPIKVPKALERKLEAQGVRLFTEAGRIVILWREGRGAPRQYETYADTPEGRAEARAYAEGKADLLATPRPGAPDAPPAVTVAQLWDRYVAAIWTESEEGDLSPAAATRTNYAHHWRQWQAFTTPRFPADETTLEMVDQFRAEQTKAGIAVNQIRQCLGVVKLVYNWGRSRKVLSVNELPGYRFNVPKGQGALEPPEFRSDEWERILRAIGGQSALTWRAWVVTMIAGSQGMRANAVRHIDLVKDVDLVDLQLRWAPQWDKNRRERWQPLTLDAYSAILTALYWRREAGYEGPWLIPGRSWTGPYTYQGWWYHFDEACQRAGVAREKYQAMHAFRKMASGNVLELTKDPKLALDWIGDKDPRRMREYLKVRQERLEEVAEQLGTTAESTPESAMETAINLPRKGPRARASEAAILTAALTVGSERAGEPLVGLEPTTAPSKIPPIQGENPAPDQLTAPQIPPPARQKPKKRPPKLP